MNYFFHRIVKRQARVYFFIFSCLFFYDKESTGRTLEGEGNLYINYKNDANRSDDVFRIKNNKGNYLNVLKKLIRGAESEGAIRLNPKIHTKIFLKIKTELAPGLSVSRELVDAILNILVSRGYQNDQIFVLDRYRSSLIRAGFISNVDKVKKYRGFRVFSSEDTNYFSEGWYHDSPMPPTLHDRTRFFINYRRDLSKRLDEERKSYLPSLLFLKDAFWINVAVVNDHVNLGIDGASANLTTGAISNYKRFLKKPTLAPAAVTEVLAIPEIWEKRTYSIVDLNKYQFANGGQFDAEFLGHEETILLSENPLSIDLHALRVLSEKRKNHGFLERKASDLPLFKYGKELGLGNPYEARIFDVQ